MFVFKYFVIDKKSKIIFNSTAGFEKFSLKKKYSQKIIYNSPENNPDFNLEKTNKFVFVGRLDELKNTTELVKSIHYLNQKVIRLNLIFSVKVQIIIFSKNIF